MRRPGLHDCRLQATTTTTAYLLLLLLLAPLLLLLLLLPLLLLLLILQQLLQVSLPLLLTSLLGKYTHFCSLCTCLFAVLLQPAKP